VTFSKRPVFPARFAYSEEVPVKRKAPAKAVKRKPSNRTAQGSKRSATPKKSPPAKKAIAKSPKSKKPPSFDFSGLPGASVEHSTRTLCLACIWSLFTKQLKMSAPTALSSIKKYEPAIAELTADPARPFFIPEPKQSCPYCGAAPRSHATLNVYRIVGSRATDAARKTAFDNLPKAGAALVLEEKSGRQSIVFHWLEALASKLDFSDESWMNAAARALLEKREPKTDWASQLANAPYLRRSHRLEEGWETEGNRLYLSPDLWNEILLFQYLLSRSQHGGGITFEGRLTLGELLSCLRRRGYFAGHDIGPGDGSAEISDVLEALVESLDPGTATVRLYYVIDRRDFLEKLKRFG
jgi:hypothetical protein